MLTEHTSAPPQLHFESPQPVQDALLLQADEPKMADDRESVLSLRAGPEEKNMEISTIPR